jgi:hypothetical protein
MACARPPVTTTVYLSCEDGASGPDTVLSALTKVFYMLFSVYLATFTACVFYIKK